MTEKQDTWDWLKAENHYQPPKQDTVLRPNRVMLRARRVSLRRKGK